VGQGGVVELVHRFLSKKLLLMMVLGLPASAVPVVLGEIG
jgi:hypothetical protein